MCVVFSRFGVLWPGRHDRERLQAIRRNAEGQANNAVLGKTRGDASVGARGCVPPSWLWTIVITV